MALSCLTVPQLYRTIKQKRRMTKLKSRRRRRPSRYCRRFRAFAAAAVVVKELMLLPSSRLRRRRASHPAISVTCRSISRCGYTVLPVGSTKPHEAVSLAVLAVCWNRHRPRLRLMLSHRRRPVVDAAHRGVVEVFYVEGGGGEGRNGSGVLRWWPDFDGLRLLCRELRYRSS